MPPDPWDRLHRARDTRIAETGDLWHRALIDPSVRRVVGPVRGLRVLEVACGNGYLARRFAREGAAEVVGVDRSPMAIRLARRRARATRSPARFEVGDASRLRFAHGTFDLVVANMALMDIRHAARAVSEAARVLVPGGRFVFSINHPCFDIDGRSSWVVEQAMGRDGRPTSTVSRKVSGYRAERPVRVPWDLGPREVAWTPAYHRTLATYARYLRHAGFAIVGLEEPTPEAEMLTASPQGRFIAEIPLHLVVEGRRLPVTPASRTPGRSRPGAGRRSGSAARTAGSGSARRGSRSGS